jgi:hypothetical protein
MQGGSVPLHPHLHSIEAIVFTHMRLKRRAADDGANRAGLWRSGSTPQPLDCGT